MKRKYLYLPLLLVLIAVLGCEPSDSVFTLKSPIDGISYTVETSKAAGPTSDSTRVYAHFERGGKARKILVLDGSDMTISKISWEKPYEARICLAGGITSTFRNQVTLIVGDTPQDSVTIHNQLDENCDFTPTTTPSASN